MADTVLGYEMDQLMPQPISKAAEYCRWAAGEGAVLLKNDGVLPFDGVTLSVFGRTAWDYYKSGSGSGGLVNVNYVYNIIDGLKEKKNIKLNEKLMGLYDSWRAEHPFDRGHGWGTEPWAQKEMRVTDEVCEEAAQHSDAALIVFGRLAGEDRDNVRDKGSYLLTDEEEALVKVVTVHFPKVCVALNTGSVIDTSFAEKYHVGALIYLWQGGMEGGRAAADVLSGEVNPSGKLTDTCAAEISDYPSDKSFGEPLEVRYEEDIYVGYRYFYTFAPQKVVYPFGFGLSYSTFEHMVLRAECKNGEIKVCVRTLNTGERAGKEVLQVYYEAPQGKLGKPSRALGAFVKTELIQPGQSLENTLTFPVNQMASYDDSGVTGHKSCWVLEAGDYFIYFGTDVANAKQVLKLSITPDIVVEQLQEALSPIVPMKRIKPKKKANAAGYDMTLEDVPTRSYDMQMRILERRPNDFPNTGDRGYQLVDVRDKKVSMDDFVAQLSDEDLACICRGEGMNSPKVTAGTGCAFGGVTEELKKFGIPVCCGTDGPSGLRLDSGAKATSMPNGTCLASTWNVALVEELYSYIGIEAAAYHVDCLLGPGVNIHRHPLNGRNFEYFSEDPLLAGKLAAGIVRGMAKSRTGAVVKHLAGNSQEFKRHTSDSIASERAYREIYLKAFEIAVKEGRANLIMTSYNRVNTTFASTNYDLNTTILREDWGFGGFVMSDWWANNVDTITDTDDKSNIADCVRAQNDVYMVVSDAKTNQDNLMLWLERGCITRGQLARCAKNVLGFVMQANSFERMLTDGMKEEYKSWGITLTEVENPEFEKGYEIVVFENATINIVLEFEALPGGNSFAQHTINLDVTWGRPVPFTVSGAGGRYVGKCPLVGGRKEVIIHPFDAPLKIKKMTVTM